MLRSLFPKVHRKYLSMPVLGPVADGFDDWLAVNGYAEGSRKHSIRCCGAWIPTFDAVGLRMSPV